MDDAGPGDVTFVTNPKYASRLAGTRASAVILAATSATSPNESLPIAPCAVLRARRPYVAVAEAVAILTPPSRPAPGISSLASIDPSAELGAGVSVGAFVVLGPRVRVGARTAVHPHVVIGRDSVIGEDCTIHAQVSIRDEVVIGNRVTIQDAAVIGSDGFGFAEREDGTHLKIPQVGRVVIEDDVEIGAQSAVDRPAVGETRIGRGTKIDNLVQVAHGVKIGRNVLLAAQVGISGSTVLDDAVVMARPIWRGRPPPTRPRCSREREVRRHEGHRRRRACCRHPRRRRARLARVDGARAKVAGAAESGVGARATAGGIGNETDEPAWLTMKP